MKWTNEVTDFTMLTVKEIERYLGKKKEITAREECLLKKDKRIAVQNLLKRFQRKNGEYFRKEERFNSMIWKEISLREAGYRFIAGVDEVGRGPLAGPVVAAAVILEWSSLREDHLWYEINDSKKISSSKREQLYDLIISSAFSVGLGLVEASLIDRMNIYQASLEAMKRAVHQLYPFPQYLLSDAFIVPGVFFPQEAVKGGDSRCISIAAASIVAKVTRDKLMERCNEKHPGYGFDINKGYPTFQHKEAIKLLGPTSIHRRSFKLT